MSVAIRCAVGRFRGPVEPAPADLAGIPLEEYFARDSSLTADGQPDIRLQLDYSTLGLPLGSGEADESTDPYWLHRALRKLIGRPDDSVPPGNVGLLLSDTYAPNPSLFGLMFASRFTSGGDSFAKPERIGAALFLGAIGAARPGAADYATEVGFTAVHEMGHLFNLQHAIPPPANLMAISQADAPYRAPFSFLPEHQRWLSQCSHSRFVMPGGSDFGDFGGLSPVSSVLPANAPGRSARFALRIRLSRDEFLPCEPVELDVRLTALRTRRRIPNEIDPGYERCVLWITEPDGERRRYRHVMRYCQGRSSLLLAPGTPFERDITLFGQAGGYTFRKAGVHQIEMTLALPGAGTLRSNAVEFMVKPWLAGRQRGFARQELLTRPDVASVLFHRCASRRDTGIRRLADFCAHARHDHAAATAGYAIARAILRQAKAASRSDQRRGRHQEAQRWLRYALRHGLAGLQEKRAHRNLEELAARE